MSHERIRERLPELFADDTLNSQMPGLVPRATDLVAELLELAGDERLLDEWTEGGGWAPLLAAKLLAELKVAAAIPVLIEGLQGSDPEYADYAGFLFPLAELAHLDLDPIIAAAEEDEGNAFQEVLARSGVRDPRILDLLLSGLGTDPELYAGLLGCYGDPSVVPKLLEAFDRVPFRPDDDHLFVHQDLIELASSIEDLGGELGTARLAKVDFVVNRRKALRAERIRRPGKKPGRNQPCWCGSGKKYKRCHLDEDRR